MVSDKIGNREKELILLNRSLLKEESGFSIKFYFVINFAYYSIYCSES